MSNSPITKKFLKEEFSKFREEQFGHNTQIAGTLNSIFDKFKQIDERFDQVDKRFDQIDLRFEQVDKRFEQVDERFDGLDKIFVNKEDWANQMDLIMGELKHIREEQQANYNIDIRQNEQLEAIETHLNLAAV